MQTSGSLFFYSDFTLLRWDQIHAGNRATVMAAVAAGHRPLYAVLFPFEIQPALQGSVPGHWTQIHSVGQVSVWRRD
jgi:cytochrome b subunit of formate dehydrogenase